jgi:hypothetical protein
MMTQAKARRVSEELACAAAGAHLVEIIHRASLSPLANATRATARRTSCPCGPRAEEPTFATGLAEVARWHVHSSMPRGLHSLRPGRWRDSACTIFESQEGSACASGNKGACFGQPVLA